MARSAAAPDVRFAERSPLAIERRALPRSPYDGAMGRPDAGHDGIARLARRDRGRNAGSRAAGRRPRASTSARAGPHARQPEGAGRANPLVNGRRLGAIRAASEVAEVRALVAADGEGRARHRARAHAGKHDRGRPPRSGPCPRPYDLRARSWPADGLLRGRRRRPAPPGRPAHAAGGPGDPKPGAARPFSPGGRLAGAWRKASGSRTRIVAERSGGGSGERSVERPAARSRRSNGPARSSFRPCAGSARTRWRARRCRSEPGTASRISPMAHPPYSACSLAAGPPHEVRRGAGRPLAVRRHRSCDWPRSAPPGPISVGRADWSRSSASSRRHFIGPSGRMGSGCTTAS